MTVIAIVILSIYCLSLTYITIYCLLQFQLLYRYNKAKKTEQHEIPEINKYPIVTIQLPIFNERYVVDRLLDNISKMDYPKDRFEIQVLDDSTDDTVEISKKKVAELKAAGFDIHFIHRVDRSGYKAGALKAGMNTAKGEFIAIFDADFLPRPDFLIKTIPVFDNPKIGVVQTKWEHINEDYSLLTKLQAMQLNVHFTIEQKGRYLSDYFLQFNGTAGIWRTAAILDAGGWQADTITEDMDLSYRAQLKGWKISYQEQLGSPAELPADMNSIKSQQFRWMKGGAENARKLMPSLWNSSTLSFSKKLHASALLMSSTVYIFIFISGVFSVPLLFAMRMLGFPTIYLAVFLLGLTSVVAVYYVANVSSGSHERSLFKRSIKFIFLFPVFLALSMGLSLHNSIAVIQGYRGKKSPFVRTPKFNIKNIQDNFKSHHYLAKKISLTTILEGLLAIYFLGGVLSGIYLMDGTFMLFHLLLMVGYGYIFYFSIKHLSPS